MTTSELLTTFVLTLTALDQPPGASGPFDASDTASAILEGVADEDAPERSEDADHAIALPRHDAAFTPQGWNRSLFAEGSRTWTLMAGSSRDSSLGRIHSVQFEVNCFVRDGISWNFGGTFGYAESDAWRDGWIGGPEVGLRWHILRGERSSFFIEGSAGIVLQQHPLTRESLNFNFDLKAGAGVTYSINERTAVLTSLRWHHLSNARFRGKRRNLGYDGPMLAIGLIRSF